MFNVAIIVQYCIHTCIIYWCICMGEAGNDLLWLSSLRYILYTCMYIIIVTECYTKQNQINHSHVSHLSNNVYSYCYTSVSVLQHKITTGKLTKFLQSYRPEDYIIYFSVHVHRINAYAFKNNFKIANL